MSLTKKISKTRIFTVVDTLEDELSAKKDLIQPTAESPVRFEILKERLKRNEGGPPFQMLPTMLQSLSGIKKSLRSLADNPLSPKTQGSDELFQEIEAFTIACGASSVGYTRIPSRWVFKNKAIGFENAIILSMEMDKDGINTAPSLACMKTVMETYRDLGRISNKIAALLRTYGYAAHAGHPLGGLALYPPLAQMAGLGWIGLNGIIITPEHGPRIRLAAVFTSIENLPFCDQNEHNWVTEYCSTCKICLKECPPKALYETPVDHGNGQITYVDNDLCFPYFCDYYGCSVCVRVCPFNHERYNKIKAGFERNK